MTTRRDIEEALFAAVAALGVGLPIAWPNVDFVKPDNQQYIEAIHFPNVPVDYALANDATPIFQGFLQLNVHYTPNLGTLAIQSVIDTILATFTKGATFINGTASVRVNGVPGVGQFIAEQNFVPVRIEYRTIS